MIPTILVIAKEPRPGFVKTRLCPPWTPDHAAHVAAGALADTLATVDTVVGVRRVLVLDGTPGAWLPHGWQVRPQVDGGLADRLTAAFAPHAGPTVLIGMDTPQVTRADIDGAVEALADPATDAVIGPTDDGGWWLIGFSGPTPGAFTGVPMSRADTYDRQYRRLAELGCRTRVVATRRDVDHHADALAVADAIPGSRFAAAVRAADAAELHPTGGRS